MNNSGIPSSAFVNQRVFMGRTNRAYMTKKKSRQNMEIEMRNIINVFWGSTLWSGGGSERQGVMHL